MLRPRRWLGRERPPSGGRLVPILVLTVLQAGCDAGSPVGVEPTEPEARVAEHEIRPGSANAQPELVETLRRDLEATRHPADGAGRAWIESAEPLGAADGPLVAGEPARFRIVFEAGPLGVAPGGAVFLETPLFWSWDPAQISDPNGPGFTEVSTSADGVVLSSRDLGRGTIRFGVGGRELREGERVVIDYGGPVGARVDRYAERESRIWVSVDGDGDRVRRPLPDSPAVDIHPRVPSNLLLTVPSTARPGETVRLTVALLDGRGNAGVPFEGDVVLTPALGLELPERISFETQHGGRRSVEARVIEEGVYRIRGETGSIVGVSNPLVATAAPRRILWADLHGHSGLSDGTGTPEDYYVYARDVAGLDVAVLTDHDHWGMRKLDVHPEMWERIRQTAARYHEPGRFVTLLGYEWTSWLYGHRHVLFFGPDADGGPRGELWSSIALETDAPDELWQEIAEYEAETGIEVLTFAHHSAGGPIATDWSFVPDPGIEPVTEIVSVHGSSEASDSPALIHEPVAGNFVRDVLDRGLRFGFVGSGDSHDGHPGLPVGGVARGLAAILAEETTRGAVLEALRARRVYATSGPRILLRFTVDGHPMGSTLPATAGEAADAHRLEWSVVGTAPVDRIELIHGGGVVAMTGARGRMEVADRTSLPRLPPGGYVYLRVIQEDGALAWSSPVYQDPAADP